MAYIVLGAQTKSEVSAFLEYLHAYMDAVGTAVGEEPLDFSATSVSGDVADLFRALNKDE